MINFESHIEDRAMETYRTWIRLFELLPYCSWIVDRFYISIKKYLQLLYKFFNIVKSKLFIIILPFNINK
ncbi:MAG: hypothetical protein JSW07_05885, partial [bacterium]